MKAYHFLRSDMTTGYGNEPPWTVGETRKITGKVALCERGYHSSPSFYAALGYAPGNIACIDDISRCVEKDSTKQVSRRRTLVAAFDATNVLRRWGLECARAALLAEREAGREPDKRSWHVIDVLARHIEGKATNKELSAARRAAWSAESATRYAAWCSAEHAARSAAWSAAESAEGSAAEARHAAWDAARFAARSAAESAAESAVGSATRHGAWVAAKDAAESAQEKLLQQMMMAEFA